MLELLIDSIPARAIFNSQSVKAIVKHIKYRLATLYLANLARWHRFVLRWAVRVHAHIVILKDVANCVNICASVSRTSHLSAHHKTKLDDVIINIWKSHEKKLPQTHHETVTSCSGYKPMSTRQTTRYPM